MRTCGASCLDRTSSRCSAVYACTDWPAITESGEPMLITQNGEAKVVVQDAQSYEDMQQTVALLKILAMGQNDIETGNFTPTDEVFAELERMDREEGIE